MAEEKANLEAARAARVQVSAVEVIFYVRGSRDKYDLVWSAGGALVKDCRAVWALISHAAVGWEACLMGHCKE
jgi:hypothetical protein